MRPLKQRLVAEALGTAFLLMAVVGSGSMGRRLAGGNVAITTTFMSGDRPLFRFGVRPRSMDEYRPGGSVPCQPIRALRHAHERFR